LSTKTDQLEWRRDKVIELRAIGMSYAEIAQHLQVSKTSIVSDMHYIREHAKQSIKEYTTQHLPEQYQVCLSALDTILKNAFVIMQKTEDNREKLAAMQLFKDTHMTKLELLSNATTIDSALQFIRSKQQEQRKKGQALDSASDEDANQSISNPITNTATGKQSVF
jgi:hypothetical protein